jgi:hypothetical protein
MALPPDEDDLEEKALQDKYNERFQSLPYRQVFYPPAGAWNIDGLFPEAYYESAMVLLRGISENREFYEGVHGVAAVFLCRHCLELLLKYTLYHSRWLRDRRTNADAGEIQPVGKDRHQLVPLWDTLKGELTKKGLTHNLDLAFVERFVKEFDHVDSRGMRFRYPGDQLPVLCKSDDSLRIDFAALSFDLKHVYDVLGTLDNLLIELHGENEEWESEMRSW